MSKEPSITDALAENSVRSLACQFCSCLLVVPKAAVQSLTGKQQWYCTVGSCNFMLLQSVQWELNTWFHLNNICKKMRKFWATKPARTNSSSLIKIIPYRKDKRKPNSVGLTEIFPTDWKLELISDIPEDIIIVLLLYHGKLQSIHWKNSTSRTVFVKKIGRKEKTNLVFPKMIETTHDLIVIAIHMGCPIINTCAVRFF